MTALLLAPHNDDETLFASFLLMQHRAEVVICLRSYSQERFGIDALTREEETARALGELGGAGIGSVPWDQWIVRDDDIDFEHLGRNMAALALGEWSVVIAPEFEYGGHEGHNAVAKAVDEAFRTHPNVVRYMTYQRGGGKSLGVEVVPEPWMIERKLRALACYRSQIEEPSCRPWFMGDLKEYVAA